jgi:DNA-directed RNA polymerase specialized sigma subunit
MSVKEILEAIRSHEMDVYIKIGCLDDATLIKYKDIMRILLDSELLNGFKDDSYNVLDMFYIQGMKVSEVAKVIDKSERQFFRIRDKGIENLEKIEARRAKIAPPGIGS